MSGIPKQLGFKAFDIVSQYVGELDLTKEADYNAMVEMGYRLDNLVMEIDRRINPHEVIAA